MTLDKIVRSPAILFAILIVLVIGFLIYTYYVKYEGFVNFRDQQNKYTQGQRSEFWDNLNLQLDYNSELEKDLQKGLNDALNSIDPMTKKTKKNDFSSFFRKDPIPGINTSNECSGISEPYLLPQHDKNAAIGCGWWYSDDDTLLSFGSRGTEKGPFGDLEKSNPKGQWIWDLGAAQKLEDVKRCRRIKTCDMADLLAEKCGFCNILNVGIPAGKNGASKYLDDAKYTCPEPLIMSPPKCPKLIPEPTVVLLPDGTVTVAAPPPEICDPVKGKLSKECLISLANGAGCSNNGVIISILKGDVKGYLTGIGETGFKYKKSLEILKKTALLEVQSPFLGIGVCERSDALDFYQKLVNLILRGKTARVRDAASFLALGTSEFDPCDYDPDEFGPFDDYCLERVAREEGCQPDGSDFPSKPANKNRFYAMDWKSVNTHFSNLHRNLLSKDQDTLTDASMKCLGVQIVPKVSECGDKRGVEVLWYKWENEWDMPDRSQSAQTFYGREIKANMPNFDTAGTDYNPWKVKDSMSFHARTQLIPAKQYAGRMWSMTGGGLAIKLNNKPVLKTWREQAATSYTTDSYMLNGQTPNNLDVFWFKGFGSSTFLPKISNPDDITQYLGITASDLNLAVPDTFPLCRWDLYMGTPSERNNVLTSNPENMKMGVVDGKKCAILDNQGGINITNHIMGTAFKSFTFMVYNRGGWVRLFALRSGSCSMSDWNGWSIEGGLCSDSRAWFCFQSNGGKQDIYISSPDKTVPMNKWTHIAFSIDDDFRGVTIYCDSVIIARKRNEIMNPSDYKETKYNIATIGHAGWNCSKTIVPPPSANGIVPVKPSPVGPPQCLGLGRPNSDASLRVYSQSECDQLDGSFHGNGECTKKTGGSWSWDCRELNKAEVMTITEATYGGNCPNGNSLKGNRTDLFKSLANGLPSLKYVYDFLTTGGDPSEGCPKTLEINYSCGQDKKKVTVNAEAGINGNVDIGCGPQYNNLALRPLPPPDCPPVKDGSLNIGLAWVHWFDYTLTSKEIKNDIIMAYTDETVYEEDLKSGWKKGK